MSHRSKPRSPFFVYGTLRPGERNHRLLAGQICSEELAFAAGLLLLDFGPFPIARPGRGRVSGHLVSVHDEVYDQVLADLDALEGFTGHPLTSFYVRRRWQVSTAAGEHAAWVYLAGPTTAVDDLPLISGGDWVSSLRSRTRSMEPLAPR